MTFRILTSSRRSAMGILALAASALAGPSFAQSQPAQPAYLLVGDMVAGKLYIYGGAGWSLQATLDDLVVAGHAGMLALADGRVLIPDDRNKQLVVLRLGQGAPTVERRVPMPIPLPTRYAWAAADPAGTVLAVSGLDGDESVKLLTLVDLKTYASRQFRVDTGSPDAELNLSVGGAGTGTVVLLHLAERVDTFRVVDLLRPDAKINGILDGTIKPAATLQVGRGGHSDSFSAPTSKWTGSTLRGLEIATLRADGTLESHQTLPWEANERSGGRNARQRLAADGRHVFGPLSATVPPARWAEAEVDLHWVNLESNAAYRLPLARGQVGRGGVSATFAVYASVHPEGDHANLIDVDPASPGFRQVAARVVLPRLAGGPVPDQPVAGKEARHAAITPDGRFAFVSQGGEGKVHVIDTAARRLAAALEVPTPLRGGGYIVAIEPGRVTADFSAR